MVMVSIVDETTAGRVHDAWHLEIFEERLPLREVIRRRVFQKVAEHNARHSGGFRGLVQPTDPSESSTASACTSIAGGPAPPV